MSRKLWAVCIFALGLAMGATPRSAMAQAPAAALDVRVQRADALLTAYKADRPGIGVLVMQRGQVAYERYLGAADLEHDQAVTAKTRFHVASVSKQFTAFAVAQLAAEGKVDMAADIRTYLPEMPDFGKKVTVADLLHHTSGIRDQWGMFVLAGNDFQDFLTQGAILSYAKNGKGLNFAPGAEYEYCNTGYSLAATIVERVSGMSLRRFLAERVFTPLGMTDTLVYDNAAELMPGRAMSYVLGADGKPRLARLNYNNYGATSLHTTARDLAKWSAEMLHPKVLDPAVLKAMRQPGRLTDGSQIPYGLGLSLSDLAGHHAFGHGGSDAGYRAYIVSFPDDDATIAITSTGAPDVGALSSKLADIFLNGGTGDAPAGPTTTASPETLQKLVGVYTNDRSPAMELRVVNGQLMRFGGGIPQAARFQGDGGFYFDQPTSVVRLAPNGRDLVMTPTQGPPMAIRRVVRVTPTATELAALVGDYRSEELDVTYHLAVVNGVLQFSSLRTPPVGMTPLDKDRFEAPLFYGAVFRVVRDAKGAPKELRIGLMGGRVRDVALVRVRPGA
jgi:CubicO group peptidase (beta-lactamase class C family)